MFKRTQPFKKSLFSSLSPLGWLLLSVFQLGCGHFVAPNFQSSLKSIKPILEPEVQVLSEYRSLEQIERDKQSLRNEGPTLKESSKEISEKSFFDWPVDQAKITQEFKDHKHRKPHLGLDLADKKNSPIYASHDGVVVYTGSGFTGFGRFIIIEYGKTWATFYGHLNKSLVKKGDRVQQGQKIGLMGNTGRSSGVHLHFEIRKKGRALDPVAFLPKSSHPELLAKE